MRHEEINDLFRPLVDGLNPAILTDVYQDRINELEKEKKYLVNDNKRLKKELEEIRLEQSGDEFIICPGCAGAGDVRQTAKSNDIEETWIKCVECLGNRKVQKWVNCKNIGARFTK